MNLNNAFLFFFHQNTSVTSLGGGQHPFPSLQSWWIGALGYETVRYSAKNVYAKYLKLPSEMAMNTDETQYNDLGEIPMEGWADPSDWSFNQEPCRMAQMGVFGSRREKVTLKEKSSYRLIPLEEREHID